MNGTLILQMTGLCADNQQMTVKQGIINHGDSITLIAFLVTFLFIFRSH